MKLLSTDPLGFLHMVQVLIPILPQLSHGLVHMFVCLKKIQKIWIKDKSSIQNGEMFHFEVRYKIIRGLERLKG